jgi:hypothetical protein
VIKRLVISKIITEVLIKIRVFWDMTPCKMVVLEKPAAPIFGIDQEEESLSGDKARQPG